MIERMVVVLPTPLRPSRQTHSPGLMSSETPNSTRLEAVGGVDVLEPRAGAVNACLPRGRRGAPPRCWRTSSGAPVGDDAALVQHGDLVRDREHHVHVVLGEQQRQAALAWRCARAARSTRASPGALMPAVGSSSSRMLGSPASAMPSSTCFWAPWLRVRRRSCARRPAGPAARASPRSCRGTGASPTPHMFEAAPAVGDEGGLDVLVDGELREDVGALERARHAHAGRSCAGAMPVMLRPSSSTSPAVRHEMAGDQVEERRSCRRRWAR